MAGRLGNRFRTTKSTDGIDEIGWGIGCAALAAIVTVLVGRFASWARTFHEPICQKSPCDRIEQLFDIPFGDQIGIAKRLPNIFT